MVAIVPTSGRKRRRPARESDTVTVGRRRSATVAANTVGIVFVVVMASRSTGC
jgi:hypothetical protein